MAKGGRSGDWLLVEELLERGDPALVDALRKIDDAEALGALAPRWFADRRPEARALLFDYLDRPLNAFRHEALVKRLFKLAEAAGDDALLARFLVAFDRSVRRARGRRLFTRYQEVNDPKVADALAAAWREEGFASVNVWLNWRRRYQVSGYRHDPVIETPRGTAMPRGTPVEKADPYSWDIKTFRSRTFTVPDWVFKLGLNPRQYLKGERLPESKRKDLLRFRLFSMPTRHYLRRRAWRYFRRLGRSDPGRYVAAVVSALLAYRDEDTADGLALIDNWGLIHILFHHSPVLVASDRAWQVAPGRSLAELEPAPMFAGAWAAAPRAAVDLLVGGRCRAVRGWAVRMIRRDLAAASRVFPLDERLGLLGDDDPEVVALVAELLHDDPALAEVPPARWLALVESASPAALEVVCDLMRRHVAPDRVTLAEAARLAAARPLPAARLGLDWLRDKAPRDETEGRALLGLIDAESTPLRAEILAWTRRTLEASAWSRPEWILDWLDSRHADARAEGWRWFASEPKVRDDVAAWRRLMETPHDDVRLALVGALESRGEADAGRLDRGDLDAETLRRLWASVLLNVRRGSRAKPRVLRQLLRRLESRPDDLPQLLPLLAVALRSVRGPERRAGLAAVVRLADRDERAAGAVLEALPELQFR